MSPSHVSVAPSKIFVPIDFSPSSHQALDAAAELAEKYGASLYLLHVVPEYPGYALPASVSQQSIIDESRKTAEEHFELSLKGLRAKGIEAAAGVEVSNDVAGSILDAMEREHADLLV